MDRKTLKERYLKCFAVRSTNTKTLQEVVKELLQLGIVRGTLVRWDVQTGYSHGYVRSLLSKILCPLGLRERGLRGERKPSPEALELLGHAQEQYGDQALKILRAAYRAGQTQAAERGSTSESSRIILTPIAVPQLWNPEGNCGTAIRRSRPLGVRAGTNRSQIFPRSSNSLATSNL